MSNDYYSEEKPVNNISPCHIYQNSLPLDEMKIGVVDFILPT